MAQNKNEWQARVKIKDGNFFFKKNQHPAAYKGAILCVVNPLRHSGHRFYLSL
jgi:hypothetical protein